MNVRVETADDYAGIAGVVEAAFGDTAVAEMTAAIRASDGYVRELAFVAEDDGGLIGHTMLSYLWIEGTERRVLQLGPMAVRPDRQRQGIGTALVRTALRAADERREPLVLVEGVPSYYPRFGFRPASELGLLRPHDSIPEAAWMALPLREYDPSLRGRVIYPPWFPPPPGGRPLPPTA
jgi:putative acetyltransferase